MMTLQYYRPLGIFEQLQGQIRRDVNQLLDKHAPASQGNIAKKKDGKTNEVSENWSPAVDIREDETQFVLSADLPGVAASDIDITMDDGILVIEGQRDKVEEKDRDGYHRIERARGDFYRRFSLPDTADASRIDAAGKNGVLEITIPKLEKVPPKKIEVKF